MPLTPPLMPVALGHLHGTRQHRGEHQQEHRPQRPTERSDPTQHAKRRTGDCPGPRKETATRRTVTRGGVLCWWRQFRVAPPEPVRPPLMHHQAVSRIAKARADEDMSLLDFVVAAADLRVQCIDAARDAAPGVEAMLRAGAEGVEAMQGLVATAQQQGARAARSRLECQQQRAATALDSTETRARLECAEARVADLEAMLRDANAEAAACRGRMAELEDVDKDQQREEEVYGRLRQGCQAAAAKAQEALQVHTGCVACVCGWADACIRCGVLESPPPPKAKEPLIACFCCRSFCAESRQFPGSIDLALSLPPSGLPLLSVCLSLGGCDACIPARISGYEQSGCCRQRCRASCVPISLDRHPCGARQCSRAQHGAAVSAVGGGVRLPPTTAMEQHSLRRPTHRDSQVQQIIPQFVPRRCVSGRFGLHVGFPGAVTSSRATPTRLCQSFPSTVGVLVAGTPGAGACPPGTAASRCC